MFVKKLAEVDSSRDYIIIVDRSASMKLKGRWQEAEEACKVLCSQACKCDADGITLYFFSSHSKTSKGETPAFTKYENVATGEDVMKQFQSKNNEPHGFGELSFLLLSSSVLLLSSSVLLLSSSALLLSFSLLFLLLKYDSPSKRTVAFFGASTV